MNTLFGTEYVNVPLNLYEQGYIKSPTFSLYMDDLSAQSVSVIFGGIDQSKYTGQLYTVPRVSSTSYDVTLDSISTKGFTTHSMKVTLDSGTSLGLLPTLILQMFQQWLTLEYDSTNKYYYWPGNVKIPDQEVAFTFSGAIFSVPLSSLFIKSDLLGDPFPNGQWVFGATPTDSSPQVILLGDVFLRSMYVVYDVANPQIGLAMANFHPGKSNIVAITGPSFPNSNVAPRAKQRQGSFNGLGNGGLFGGLFGIFGRSQAVKE